MTHSDSNSDSQVWSEVRQAYMPKFEQRLFHERAGLPPEEAVKWWESHIFSAEAARAIAAGRTLDDELAFLPARREADQLDRQQREAERRRRAKEAEAEEQRREEKQLQREQIERDRVAANVDFLEGLSPRTAKLVGKITGVDLDKESEYHPGLYIDAERGRMKCAQHEIVDGYLTGEVEYFDRAFRDILEFAAEHEIADLQLAGLDADEAVELLTSDECWPVARRLFDHCSEDDPVLINDIAYHLVDDTLTPVDFE